MKNLSTGEKSQQRADPTFRERRRAKTAGEDIHTMHLRLLASLTLLLRVADVNAFSSTPALTPAHDEIPVPEPPTRRHVELGPDVTFPSHIDTNGNNLLSYDEALTYGESLPCNKYPGYAANLRLTWKANDADGDGHYSVAEALGHYHSLPAVVQNGLPACLGSDGNRRRLYDSDTVTSSAAVAAAVVPPPIPVPNPPEELVNNYDSIASTQLSLMVIYRCYQYNQCPAYVNQTKMDGFLKNVLTHFKAQESISQLSEQTTTQAIQKIKDEAHEKNAELETKALEAESLAAISATTGAVSAFLNDAPGFGLFLTAASLGTAVASQLIQITEANLEKGLQTYLSGFQQKVVDTPEMASIKEWSEAGKEMGLTFRLLQIGTSVENLQALFAALPIATQAAMLDSKMKPYFACGDPCKPYDELTVDLDKGLTALKTYISLMASPLVALENEQQLHNYIVAVANSTVGEPAQVQTSALSDINTKYFDGRLAAYSTFGLNLSGLWVVPLFIKYGPGRVWNWWRAGSNIPVVSSEGEIAIIVEERSGGTFEVDAVPFPQAENIPPEMRESLLIESGESLTDLQAIKEWLQNDALEEANKGPLTAALAKVPGPEFAASGETSKIGAFAKKAAPIGKAIIVLASAAILILEVISIVNTVELYNHYEKQIGEIASNTTKYYQDVIRAAKPPPSPP